MVVWREEQVPLVCLGQPSFIPGRLGQFRASLNMDVKVIAIRFKEAEFRHLLNHWPSNSAAYWNYLVIF